MKKLKGIVAAPFTAFTSEGEIDLKKVAAQKDFYSRNGVAGAFVCGTTGEGSALTMEERKTLFREWGNCADGHFTLIGFCGGTSLNESIELARCARECGLDAVAVTAPYYQKPENVGTLALCCASVAAAVPDLPLFYYHIPSLTGVNFAMIDLLRAVDGLIPNFAGIKYTFENLMDYQLCLNYADRKYNIMWGRDEMMLPALSIGAQAFVGSTYGYMAPVFNDIIRHFEEGDISGAAALQLDANRLIELLGKYGSGCGKAFMKAAGLDLGPCRLPLRTLIDAQYEALLNDIAALPFDRCKSIL